MDPLVEHFQNYDVNAVDQIGFENENNNPQQIGSLNNLKNFHSVLDLKRSL